MTVHDIDEGKRAALSGKMTRQIRGASRSGSGVDLRGGGVSSTGSARDLVADLRGLQLGARNGSANGGLGADGATSGGMLNASRRECT